MGFVINKASELWASGVDFVLKVIELFSTPSYMDNIWLGLQNTVIISVLSAILGLVLESVLGRTIQRLLGAMDINATRVPSTRPRIAESTEIITVFCRPSQILSI